MKDDIAYLTEHRSSVVVISAILQLKVITKPKSKVLVFFPFMRAARN